MGVRSSALHFLLSCGGLIQCQYFAEDIIHHQPYLLLAYLQSTSSTFCLCKITKGKKKYSLTVAHFQSSSFLPYLCALSIGLCLIFHSWVFTLNEDGCYDGLAKTAEAKSQKLRCAPPFTLATITYKVLRVLFYLLLPVFDS